MTPKEIYKLACQYHRLALQVDHLQEQEDYEGDDYNSETLDRLWLIRESVWEKVRSAGYVNVRRQAYIDIDHARDVWKWEMAYLPLRMGDGMHYKSQLKTRVLYRTARYWWSYGKVRTFHHEFKSMILLQEPVRALDDIPF